MNRLSSCIPLVALAILTASCALTESKSCTLVGCDSRVTAPTATVRVPKAATGLTMTACRNGACVSSKVTEDPNTSGKLRCAADFSAQAFVQCELTVQPTNETDVVPHALGASLVVSDASALSDGDRVRFELRAEGAPAPLFDTGERTVTYAVSRPNGPDCEPTCKNASL